MNIAYVRVSTEEQNEARQIEALSKFNIEKWFTEKVSGKDMERPKLKDLMDFCREGDTVYVHDFSRLARSTKDLLSMIDFFDSKKVTLVSNKESVDTGTPTGRLMVTMIAAINEFERQNMLDRQREGIAIAKREGKYKGREPKQIDTEKFNALNDEYLQRKINKTDFAKELGVSRPTLDRLLNKRAQEAGD